MAIQREMGIKKCKDRDHIGSLFRQKFIAGWTEAKAKPDLQITPATIILTPIFSLDAKKLANSSFHIPIILRKRISFIRTHPL
jgi:hypothetical protein